MSVESNNIFIYITIKIGAYNGCIACSFNATILYSKQARIQQKNPRGGDPRNKFVFVCPGGGGPRPTFATFTVNSKSLNFPEERS